MTTDTAEYVRTECGHFVPVEDTRTDASEDRITLCAEWTECGQAQEAERQSEWARAERDEWEHFGAEWTAADEWECLG